MKALLLAMFALAEPARPATAREAAVAMASQIDFAPVCAARSDWR